ncbi:hypothetical protein Q763_15290 [Flavobacterium beibuense F44-8]|uniref:DUF4468 domain-containing protein n=1 Tax=Flavobacterium beibuense F44-8 TaxID=1406840 RepID=A0A0A2LS87_9FLAO|nr:hypothetical protein [Flavobacterium beibuense]KGO79070.1 hypothetical protein Q763_15290 [Flavobacterium beibuense F44-8]
MHKITLLILFICTTAGAQPPVMEVHANGFDPVEVSIPSIPVDLFIKATDTWAYEYNRLKSPVDVTAVTANTITISAYKKNAFYYRNRGEAFFYKIRYTMTITFHVNSYTLDFKVGDIYTDGDVLVEYKLPDYFTSSGKLKDGYNMLDESLQKTVNDIVNSHYNFIIKYQ